MRRIARFWIFCVFILLLLYHYFKLENGLKVFVFNAGSIDEDKGKTGMAHLLEHTMFNGTNALGKGEIDELIRSVEGSNNAATNMTIPYIMN